MIRQSIKQDKVDKIVVGSGGSAFVDGGFGALVKGLELFDVYDSSGNSIGLETIQPHMRGEVVSLKVKSPKH